MKKKNFSTILLIIIFLVGLSVLLYPTISNYINQRTQSRAVASYDKAVADMKEEDYSAYFKAANAYNRKLAEHPDAFYDPSEVKGYEDLLNIGGTGMMGYVTIPKLHVELPIYHGTSADVLQVAAGHLEGTSLPVGGKSTHSVISAHRGLPSAKLFSKLDEMEVGDTFTITVLDRVLTYEVDKISIVLPYEVTPLQIADGKDYCTLMTCTPYGINTHRLLVRGHRIPTQNTLRVSADAVQIEPITIAPIFAVLLLIVLLIGMVIRAKRNKKK